MNSAHAPAEPARRSGFERSFLPGLILGVIVGGLAGAVLPEFMPRSAHGGPVFNSTAYSPSERLNNFDAPVEERFHAPTENAGSQRPDHAAADHAESRPAADAAAVPAADTGNP